jgi:hypothetical protein
MNTVFSSTAWRESVCLLCETGEIDDQSMLSSLRCGTCQLCSSWNIAWELLLPHVLCTLKSSCKARLELEELDRRRWRRQQLNNLLRGFKSQLEPLAWVVRNPESATEHPDSNLVEENLSAFNNEPEAHVRSIICNISSKTDSALGCP